MITECELFMKRRLADWNLPNGGDWKCLVFNNYQPQCSNIDLLWFHNGGRFPLAVTKLCRQEIPVRREFENLQRAHAWSPGQVPKPLDLHKQGAFWALWMEGIPGTPLQWETLEPAKLESLTDSIAAMHIAIRANAGVGPPDRYSRLVTTPLDTLAAFGSDATVTTGCAELRARVPVSWIDSLPVIPQHGDLFPGNMLSDRGHWRVLDWESFGNIDLPFYDLLTVLVSLLTSRGETPDRWDPRLIREVPTAIKSYAVALQLSVADVRIMLPLALANWFHLMWSDEREQFTKHMYRTINRYFAAPESWQKVFLG